MYFFEWGVMSNLVFKYNVCVEIEMGGHGFSRMPSSAVLQLYLRLGY